MKVINIAETSKGGIATYFNMIGKSSDVQNEFIAFEYPDSRKLPKYKSRLMRMVALLCVSLWDLKSSNAEIVFLHSTFAGMLRFILYSFLIFSNKKIAYCSHGWSFDRIDCSGFQRKIYVMLERFQSNFCHKIYCISEHDYNLALKEGLDKNKLQLIWNGVAPSALKLKCRKKDDDQGSVNLLFVGRLDKQKGIALILKALKSIDPLLINKIVFDVVGESVLGDSSLGTQEKTNFLNVDINWHGWVTNEKIDMYYAAADLTVMPSLWEGFGLTAVESLRNGTPVLASEAGALPYIINSNTGWLFPIENEKELAKRLLSIINERTYLGKSPSDCFNRYNTQFQGDVMNRNYRLSFLELVRC
jgi:glycosyltransferase involved in cell wall biosynthesis